MTPDRSQRPEIHPPLPVPLRKAECLTLRNGIEVYILKDDTYDVLQVDLLFDGGHIHAESVLQPMLAGQLIRRGTTRHTAEQIAEKLDYYGATFYAGITSNHTQLTLNTTGKFATAILPLLEDIIKHSTFPRKEFLILRRKAYENYRDKLSIAKHRVKQRIKEVIYGTSHPYGRSIRAKDFRLTTPDLTRDFYKQTIHSDGCRILLTGHVSEEIVRSIEDCFGGNDWHAESGTIVTDPMLPQAKRGRKRRYFLQKDDAEQSTIAFAGPVIDREDADWYPLIILTSIFGGYFGSRLMKSIREQYGYTYNIHADIHTHFRNGYVYIVTETAAETAEPLIRETFHQMDILREQAIPSEELSTAKAYLLGERALSMDGIFSHTDYWLTLLRQGWDMSHYPLYEETLRSISAERLQETAQRWLRPDLFQVIVCGKKP